ncbi:MAG: hypothetical protein R3191_03705 [Anaerolineales bacterium]|nr:hypothetical protein [Anaerolineales bacterium]
MAAAVLALVIGFIGTAWQWREAEHSRLQAERNFENALAAANTLVTEVSSTVRPLIGSKADTVRKILESSEQIFNELGNRPEVALARAQMLTELSQTYADLGDSEKAGSLADSAVDHAQSAVRNQPKDAAAISALASAYLARALMPRFITESTIADVEAGLDLAKQLPIGPNDLENIILVSRLHDAIGASIYEVSDFPRAESHFEKSGELIREALKHTPNDPRLLERLADHLHEFAGHFIQVEVQDFPKAIEMERASLAIREELAELDPSNAKHRYEMGELFFVLAILLDDPDEKIVHFGRAAQIYERLIEQDPTHKDRLFQQVRVKGALAWTYKDIGQSEKALYSYQDALQVLDSLLEHDPANELWLNRKSIFLSNLAELEEDQFNSGEAAKHYSAAVEIKRQLNTELGTSRNLRSLANSLNWSLRADEAASHIEEAIEILRHGIDLGPKPDRAVTWHTQLGSSYYVAATIALSRGFIDEAIDYQNKAIESWRFLLTNYSEVDEGQYSEWESNLALDLKYLGYIHYLGGRFYDALDAARSALTVQPDLGWVRGLMGQVFVERGQPEQALKLLQDEPCDPCRLIAQARAHDAMGKTESSLDTIRQLIEHHAKEWVPYEIAYLFALREQPDEAFEWLQKARPQDLYLVNVDPRLEPLRDDPRWPAVLEKLEQ